MPDLLIRNVPEEIVERLKERAQRNGHSLQAEALATIERATKPNGAEIAEWLATRRPQGYTQAQIDEAVQFAVDAIREDRDSR